MSSNRHGLLLYDFGPSPCARRVRISLLEKGLAWDTQAIDLSRLEQRSPAYLAINPNGFVPTLAHGERVVFESNVITEYLDDVFPETPLYPSDPWALAQVKMWQSAEAAMAKDYRALMYQRVMGPALRLTRSLDEALAAARRSTDDPADLAWEERVWRLQVLTPEEERDFEDRLWKWLDALEKSLQGGDWLVGGRFGQAEISVYPRVAMFPFVGMRITAARHPNLRRWMARCRVRPSFARTLSEQDRALARLSKTPVLPWLGRTLAKPEPGWTERLRLALLRRVFRAVLGGRSGGGRAGARSIRAPRNGEVPPRDVARRPAPKASDQVRAAPLTLYDYAPSPHARRLRVVLLEKGLPWKTLEVDVEHMAHKAPGYLAVNPDGEVPALRHGDRVLHDSQLVAEYLDRIHPEPPLFPDDAWQAAQVRMWLALEAGTHKELRPLWWLRVVRPRLLRAGLTPRSVGDGVPDGVHASYVKWLRDVVAGTPRFDTSEALAREIILGKLDRVERHLAGDAEPRDFLVGRTFTFADAAWFTRLDSFEALGIPLSEARHPNVLRWYRSLAARPSLAASAA